MRFPRCNCLCVVQIGGRGRCLGAGIDDRQRIANAGNSGQGTCFSTDPNEKYRFVSLSDIAKSGVDAQNGKFDL